jgi:hypothetical protein
MLAGFCDRWAAVWGHGALIVGVSMQPCNRKSSAWVNGGSDSFYLTSFAGRQAPIDMQPQ